MSELFLLSEVIFEWRCAKEDKATLLCLMYNTCYLVYCGSRYTLHCYNTIQSVLAATLVIFSSAIWPNSPHTLDPRYFSFH